MRKISVIIVLMSVAVQVGARSLPERDSLWNQSVASYSAADYQTALDGFLSIEKEGVRSADLYYNIANSYFKVGSYTGKSILYYERALRMDPTFEDAAHNLTLARARALDKIDVVPEFVLVTWLKNVRDSFTSNSWAVACIVLFVLTLVALFFFRFGRTAASVRTSFIAGIIFLIAAAFCFGCSISLAKELNRTDKAVIMAPVSAGKSSPNDNGQSLFVLHEGTDVTVVDELGQWIRVELSDGRQGWIHSGDIEII